jgi:hypothetical protein
MQNEECTLTGQAAQSHLEEKAEGGMRLTSNIQHRTSNIEP